MKKKYSFIFSFLCSLLIMFLLSSCSDGLPKDKYDKVLFAFKGVEESFKNVNLTSNEIEDSNISLMSATNLSNGLSIIDSCYSTSDSKGNTIDELEYNEPPMIQFQCLKYVLEKIEDSYEFGTKYYNDMTGSIYFDMETGLRKESNSEYKYDYSIRIALNININENDLINADVSFDINLTKDGKSYSTTWYVNMELDYDMENTTPNYTLSMYTANEQEALKFKAGYTYEYDYVNVKDNKINEWRKFCLETTKKLVKDSNHNSINSYLNESGFDYIVDTVKWYKNNNLRKMNQMTAENKIKVANALYGDLGLNDTNVGGQDFKNKNGNQVDAIKDLYSEMNRLFKEDVLYSLICKSEEERHGDGGSSETIQVISIEARTNNSSSGFENHTINGDPTLNDLLTNSTNWSSDSYPIIYVIWNDNGREERIDDLSKLSFEVRPMNENSIPISLNDKISDKLVSANAPGSIEKIDIIIKYPNTEVTGVIPSALGADIKGILSAGNASDDVKVLGFPLLDAALAKYTKKGDEYIITNITSSECNNYRDMLFSNGFADIGDETFEKTTNDKKLLTAIIHDAVDDSERTITLKVNSSLTDEWNQQLINSYLGEVITLPEFTSNNNILFDYVTEGDLKRINIFGTSEQEISNYIQSLVNNTNVFYISYGIPYGNQEHAGIRVVDTVNNKYYEIAMFGDRIMDISLNPNPHDIEVIKYKINNGELQTLTRDYSEIYKCMSDVVTLNQNDVIEFVGVNVTINSVDVNGSEYSASGKTITYVGSSQPTVKIWAYGYDSEAGNLSIQFEYHSQNPDKPKQ